jgi:hypothetical protein
VELTRLYDPKKKLLSIHSRRDPKDGDCFRIFYQYAEPAAKPRRKGKTMIEHATRSAIPASAPESVKRRIEERRAGKRGKKPRAKAAPVLSEAASEIEQQDAALAVIKAALEL